MFIVKIEDNFEDWRDKARGLLVQRISPEDIQWRTDVAGFMLGEPWGPPMETTSSPNIPKAFFQTAAVVSAYRDPSTWHLLYKIAYKLVYENKNLLQDRFIPEVNEFYSREKLVTKDIHKMKAFVRFREIDLEGEKVYVAWHNPDHRITKLVAPFFKDRFRGMKWMIMTEDESMRWDGEMLKFSQGVPRHKAPLPDSKEDLWKTYYKAIFNPARIKVSAMKKELPVRHWKTLPETELITSLIDEAPTRLKEFYEAQKAFAPASGIQNLPELREALQRCAACGICKHATSPVSGEGPSNAQIVFIGEQPGDQEDREGKPFIGPAGKVLHEALKVTGFRSEEIYVTNAVKGFKWVQQNSMRLHRSANSSEISACKPWLKRELELINPEITVCLGRSAAQSVIGKMIRIEDIRGKFFKSQYSDKTIVLPHPSSFLRNTDDVSNSHSYDKFLQELELIKSALSESKMPR